MKKKLAISVLSTLLLVSTVFGIAYANGSIKILVNGKQVSTDVAPRMINNRVMVPISFVSKALGADVNWNQKAQTVTVTSVGIPHADVWNENMDSMSRFDMPDINNTVQVFMAGMDQGDEILLNKSVTEDMDVELLKQQHFSMGSTMFSTQIADIRTIKKGAVGQGAEYQVRVAIQTWLDEPTIDYWDLTLVQSLQYDPNKMPFLVKSRDVVASTPVDAHRVFPGYSFTF